MLFTSAIQLTAVANVLVILASNPMWTVILSYFALGEEIKLRTVVCCLVCFGAIVLIFVSDLQASQDQKLSSDSLLGNILALFASFTLGGYFVLLRVASKFEGVEPDMLPCNVIAGFSAGFVSLILGAAPLAVKNTREVAFLCLQGIITLPLSFALLTIGPSLITATEVSLYMLIETVLGPCWVYLAGFESPPQLTVYGGIILISALFIHSIIALREDILIARSRLSENNSKTFTTEGIHEELELANLHAPAEEPGHEGMDSSKKAEAEMDYGMEDRDGEAELVAAEKVEGTEKSREWVRTTVEYVSIVTELCDDEPEHSKI